MKIKGTMKFKGFEMGHDSQGTYGGSDKRTSSDTAKLPDFTFDGEFEASVEEAMQLFKDFHLYMEEKRKEQEQEKEIEKEIERIKKEVKEFHKKFNEKKDNNPDMYKEV